MCLSFSINLQSHIYPVLSTHRIGLFCFTKISQSRLVPSRMYLQLQSLFFLKISRNKDSNCPVVCSSIHHRSTKSKESLSTGCFQWWRADLLGPVWASLSPWHRKQASRKPNSTCTEVQENAGMLSRH